MDFSNDYFRERGYCKHRFPIIEDAVFLHILQFFQLPLGDKTEAASKDRARRGYSPSGSENFATLVGETRENDCVEKFRVGPEVSPSKRSENDVYFSSKSAKVHFFPNDWSFVEESFKRSALNVYWSAEVIMRQILELLGESFPLSLFNLHTSILSLNYYRQTSYPAEKQRIAEHKDISFFTIVSALTDDDDSSNNARLQIFDRIENNWCDIMLKPGECVILAGEYLEYVSRGRYQAVLHRVVQNSEILKTEERVSFAFFVAPEYDANISFEFPEEQVCESVHESRTYDEWRKWKISQAMRVAKLGRS